MAPFFLSQFIAYYLLPDVVVYAVYTAHATGVLGVVPGSVSETVISAGDVDERAVRDIQVDGRTDNDAGGLC